MEAFETLDDGLLWGNQNGSGPFSFLVCEDDEYNIYGWRGLALTHGATLY